MNNQETPDLLDPLGGLETLPPDSEPLGWSRRNWVKREAAAFAVAAAAMIRPHAKPLAE